jgi:hypothetical protein
VSGVLSAVGEGSSIEENGDTPAGEGLADWGRIAGWGLELGAVTPGIASIGPASGRAGAGCATPLPTAEAGLGLAGRGLAGFGVAAGWGSDAEALGGSRSGGSSGGGSWAVARAARHRTTHNDRTVTRMDIQHSSRYESRRAGIETPRHLSSVAVAGGDPFFLPESLGRHYFSFVRICKQSFHPTPDSLDPCSRPVGLIGLGDT